MPIETEPSATDGQTVSLRRMAQSLYEMTQFGTAPTEGDSVLVSLRKIAAMLAAVADAEVGTYDAGMLHASNGIDWNNGPVQKATMPASAVTACPIANGSAGAELELWLTGQASNRAFTGLSGGGLPSDSLFAWPKTIIATKVYILKFKNVAGTWKLVSLVGGF